MKFRLCWQISLLFFHVFLFLKNDPSQAQTRTNELHVAAGLLYGYIQDRHAAPVTYALQGTRYGVGFGHQGASSYWAVDLVVGAGESSPRHLRNTTLNLSWPVDINGVPQLERTTYRAGYLDVQLRAEYLRRVTLPGRLKLWIGPGLLGSIRYTEMSRYFWPLAVNGITLSARSTYTPAPRHQVIGGLSTYLVGFVSRFTYASDPSLPNTTVVKSFFKEDTACKTLARFQQLYIYGSYTYRVKKNISLGVHYSFGWVSTEAPRPLRIAEGNYQTLITFIL